VADDDTAFLTAMPGDRLTVLSSTCTVVRSAWDVDRPLLVGRRLFRLLSSASPPVIHRPLCPYPNLKPTWGRATPAAEAVGADLRVHCSPERRAQVISFVEKPARPVVPRGPDGRRCARRLDRNPTIASRKGSTPASSFSGQPPANPACTPRAPGRECRRRYRASGED
jgi:hypothetical protein